MKKNITTTETTAVVWFNFGSVATVGVTLYEGLSIDECIALRSEDIEEYKIACGEWTTRKATADEARQHLEALRNEEETESTEGGEETAPAFTITKNDQFNSVEVSFSGKPSAEDLEQIDRQRQEAENAQKAAEHEAELRERENYLAQRVHGQRLIRAEQEAHPVKADQPIVTIMWSEHPAFSDYEDGELILSVTAAENILHTLDKEQHESRETDNGRGWYYKTKFTISGVDFEGEPLEYEGRYDLGDGDGGLVQHIRSFGEWNRTHGHFGQPIENPEESNGTIRFADYLAGIIESEEERKECEIVTLAPSDAGCVW